MAICLRDAMKRVIRRRSRLVREWVWKASNKELTGRRVKRHRWQWVASRSARTGKPQASRWNKSDWLPHCIPFTVSMATTLSSTLHTSFLLCKQGKRTQFELLTLILHKNMLFINLHFPIEINIESLLLQMAPCQRELNIAWKLNQGAQRAKLRVFRMMIGQWSWQVDE